MVLSKIHAVSTQGLIMGLLMAAIVGFGAGQYFKAGKRVSFNSSTALKS